MTISIYDKNTGNLKIRFNDLTDISFDVSQYNYIKFHANWKEGKGITVCCNPEKENMIITNIPY